jgi:imidazolonepropionase-like amidohydrolase
VSNPVPNFAPLSWLFAALLAGLVAPALAQDTRPVETRPAETQPTTTTTSTPATASIPATAGTTTGTTTTTQAAKKPDRHLAVIHGTIHTVTGPTLADATLLSKNGKIVAIGRDLPLPPECEVVDARGMHVYPGLIAVSSSGFVGGEPPDDTTDVFSLGMNLALAAGITTAVTGNTAAKLTWGSVDGLLLKRNLLHNLRYSTGAPLARAELRADLEKVRDYLRKLREYELVKDRDKSAKAPEKDWLKGKYEDYRKLLTRETIAVTNANGQEELLALADLAETYDFDLLIRGAYEGWTCAARLGRAGVRTIITPRTSVIASRLVNRPTGSTIENARLLHEHGVTVAVIPGTTGIMTWGLGGRDMQHLNLEAAFAVRGGLSNDAAIRTITIDAARVLGLDDRVGSLEVGKDADCIIVSGDLLHYMTLVHYTVVNGRLAYDKAEDSLFRHIRPEGTPAIPTFENDSWPRRLAWPDDSAVPQPPATAPSPLRQ